MSKIAVLVSFIFILASFYVVHAQQIGWGDMMPCVSGEYRPCGINIGECKKGVRVCEDGQWGECKNQIGPTEEICGNGKDEDCNGIVDDCIDNTFGYICIGAGVIILIFAFILSKIKVHEKEEF